MYHSSYYTFNKKFYFQKKGMCIGSPLAGILAELVIRYQEKDTLESLRKEFRLFVCYMDNIFIVTEGGGKENLFKEVLSNNNLGLKPNIKQVSENIAYYLDVNVEIVNVEYVTSIYRKLTCRAIFIPNNSHDPLRFKHAAFRALFRRVFIHCSNEWTQKQEIDLIVKEGLRHSFSYKRLLNLFNKVRKNVILPKTQKSQNRKRHYFRKIDYLIQ